MTDMTLATYDGERPLGITAAAHAVADAAPLAPQLLPGTAGVIDGSALRRRVVRLAAPVIGENLLETLLGIIDTLLVAGLGAGAIAGVGGALQVLWFVMAALSALAVGSSVLVAQAYGAQNPERASELARQSLLWCAILSVPLALGGFLLAGPITALFRLEPAVSAIAAAYLKITMGTVIVMVMLFIGGGVLRGVGDARTPMAVTAIANVLNVGLAYGLIYGRFGLPALGASGSAWATLIARLIALALLLRVLWYGRDGVRIGGRGTWRPELRVAVDVLRIGVPAALEQLLVSIALMALAIVAARLGTTTLAAHRISFTALSFSFLPGIGFGVAATALVGQSVGARRIAEGGQAASIATYWGTLWMSLIALLFLLFAPRVMGFFTADPLLVSGGAGALRVVGFMQPFWAVILIQSGALRGTGNTRFPLLVSGGGSCACVVLGWLLLQVFGGGLVTLWSAWLIGSPLMAALYWWRFRKAVREIGGAPLAGSA